MKIKFTEYNGIEGYIELMKHDVEPLNDPECTRLDLCYNGKDIKAVLDYITNLQQTKEILDKRIHRAIGYATVNSERLGVWNHLVKEMINILEGSEDND